MLPLGTCLLSVLYVLTTSSQVPDDRREAARGVELLLAATLLHNYGADEDDADPEALEVRTRYVTALPSEPALTQSLSPRHSLVPLCPSPHPRRAAWTGQRACSPRSRHRARRARKSGDPHSYHPSTELDTTSTTQNEEVIARRLGQQPNMYIL